MSTQHEPPFDTPAYQNYLETMKKQFIPTTDQQLKQRQQLCKDLEYLCSEDSTILEELIDEYVYLLSDHHREELQEFVTKELEADFG